MSVSTRPIGEWLLLTALVLIVALLSLAPLARLLLESIAPGGEWSTTALAEVLGDPLTWRATGRSLFTALGGTLIALALGCTFALLVALTDLRGKPFLVFGFLLPLMIPPQITALAWTQLFGPSSVLLRTLGLAPPLGTPNPLYSPGGIILLLGIQHGPLVFLALRAGLRSLPRELVEGARASGARPFRVLATVVLPLMTPPLVAGTALAFVSCIGNFGIPALLGIPANYTVLPTLIYRRLAGFGPAVIAEVAVLSVLVGLIAVVGVLAQGWVLGRRDYRIIGPPAQPLALSLGRWRGAVEALCWLLIVLILVLPLTALVSTSLVSAYGVALGPDTLTLDNYVEVLLRQSVTVRAFRNSLLLAGGAALALALLAGPLGYFLVWHRNRLLAGLNLLAELPYALPGVVLAIACILLFLRPLPVLGVSLYGTVWIIFVAYLARFLTLALRPAIGGFHQLDRSLEEAARSCGAGFAKRLRSVVLPPVVPLLGAGAILVFLTAVNELTVSALLWSSGSETLGVVVFNLDDGGYTVLAAAVAVLTVILILVLMLLGSWLSRYLPPGALPWEA